MTILFCPSLGVRRGQGWSCSSFLPLTLTAYINSSPHPGSNIQTLPTSCPVQLFAGVVSVLCSMNEFLSISVIEGRKKSRCTYHGSQAAAELPSLALTSSVVSSGPQRQMCQRGQCLHKAAGLVTPSRGAGRSMWLGLRERREMINIEVFRPS